MKKKEPIQIPKLLFGVTATILIMLVGPVDASRSADQMRPRLTAHRTVRHAIKAASSRSTSAAVRKSPLTLRAYMMYES